MSLTCSFGEDLYGQERGRRIEGELGLCSYWEIVNLDYVQIDSVTDDSHCINIGMLREIVCIYCAGDHTHLI